MGILKLDLILVLLVPPLVSPVKILLLTVYYVRRLILISIPNVQLVCIDFSI